jgi:nicotinamide-nucleotide amidase
LVPDEIETIAGVLADVSAVSEVVLITGGLGPTEDDLTRHALARYLGCPLEFRGEVWETIERFFSSRGFKAASTNRVQAYFPVGSEVLANPRGTACGIAAQKDGKWYFCMPGVPAEMMAMFEESVGPRLAAAGDSGVIEMGKVRCFGVGESVIAEKVGDLMRRDRNPQINTTVEGGDILLHIAASATDRQTARGMIEADKHLLCRLLGDAVYGFDEESLPEAVGRLLRERGLKLAAAESCTGGLLAKLITDVPGSSEYFSAGWVTYSNEAKIRDLGVPEELIRQHGAVSEPVAGAMAAGAARRSGADAAIGITGIAGPAGGTAEKPVGLVCMGWYWEGKTEVQSFRFAPVGRQEVRRRACLTALNRLRIQLKV